MHTTRVFGISLIFSFTTTLSFSQTSAGPVTARDIVKQSIQAMGGEQYLRSVKTLYTEMSTEMSGREVTWITKEMVPNKGAFQIVHDGRVVYENWFDGTKGYEINDGKKTDASNDFKDKTFRKNIFNELDYLDSSVWRIELMETEKVKGNLCYKIRAVFADGNESRLYFDKQTFHLIRQDRVNRNDRSEISTTYFAGFKKYGELTFYSEIIQGEGEAVNKATITTLLTNAKISDADFNK